MTLASTAASTETLLGAEEIAVNNGKESEQGVQSANPFHVANLGTCIAFAAIRVGYWACNSRRSSCEALTAYQLWVAVWLLVLERFVL